MTIFKLKYHDSLRFEQESNAFKSMAFQVSVGGVKTRKCDEYILLEIMCNR